MEDRAELVNKLERLWLVEAGVEALEDVAGEDGRLVCFGHLRQDHPIEHQQVESGLVAG